MPWQMRLSDEERQENLKYGDDQASSYSPGIPQQKRGDIALGASRLIGRSVYGIEHDPGGRRIYPKHGNGTS